MSAEGFPAQVEALAKRLGKQFPLKEDELNVGLIEFSKNGETLMTIEASGKNLASRLFAESLAFEPLERHVVQGVPITDEEIVQARAYFVAYWDDEPFTGKHPFIDGLKQIHEVGGMMYLSAKKKESSMFSGLEEVINRAWEERDSIGIDTRGQVRDSVNAVIELLDSGQIRVAEKIDGEWTVNQWVKKAVLLSFRLNPNTLIVPGTSGAWWDKVPGKFDGWTAREFESAGLRAVPGSIARRGAFIGKNVVLMPSFTNIGAYVDEGTMVDTWATVGSCAQVGKNCHISGGAGIGGVLEPLQANPVIIEDNCFIGARAEVAEGVIVREGSVLSMGVYLGKSTKIIDRNTGEVFQGEVPPYSVVVPGSLPDPSGKCSLYCAVIVKTVDAQTRSKTSINELLRD